MSEQTENREDVLERLVVGIEEQNDRERKKAEKEEIQAQTPAMKGLRTKTFGWVTVIAAAGGVVGIDLNPDLIVSWVQDFRDQLVIVFSSLGAAIHYFRNQADKNEEQQ